MDVDPIENAIGIQTYFTNRPGVGGRLRAKVEDFIVEEINTANEIIKLLNKTDLQFDSKLLQASTINLVLEKSNLETFNVVHQIASFLQIPYHNIGFAGLKDKRALTSQLISISAPKLERLQDFHYKGIHLNRATVGKPLKLGYLNGNHFHIIIRQMEPKFEEIVTNFNLIKHAIQNAAIPNYYGPQRFGALRPISHLVGRALLYGDFETAAKIYLTEIFAQEPETIKDIRQALYDSWPQPMVEFPKSYIYENKIIHNLKHHSPNYKKIFRKVFPTRYFTLFIHAFQSYLFNQLLSIRLKKNYPFEEALEGDYVALIDQFTLPTRVIYTVTSHNIKALNNALMKGKAVIMAPLIGYDLNFSKHPLKDDFERILQDEDVDLSLFSLSSEDRLRFKTTYRPIVLKAKEFTSTIEAPTELEPDPLAYLSFFLNKGSYATVLLREFMKTSPLKY